MRAINIWSILLFIPASLFSLTINVKVLGAKGNGFHDDTTAFQQGIDRLKQNGGGTMIVPSGKYPITFLKFFGKEYSNITILGENATIVQRIVGVRKSAENNKFKTFAQRHAADGCFVFDAQVSKQKDDSQSIKNIKISGLNFVSDVGKHGFDELLHQISAHGVSNFVVENCTFTGFLGDGIAINGGTDFSKFHDAYNKDVVIRNCKFDGVNGNNRQAISIYYSDGFLIDKCTFRNTTRDDMPGAIDIEPDREMNVVRNGVISNCSFYNIGGLAAVVINLRNPSKENQLSGSGFLIENCRFKKISSPLGIYSKDFSHPAVHPGSAVVFRRSDVTETSTPFQIVNSKQILFEDITYSDVRLPMSRPVTALSCVNLSFRNCDFGNLNSVSDFIFYGSVHNVLFTNCLFAGRKTEKLFLKEIKPVDKFAKSSTYLFWLDHYGRYLALIAVLLLNGLNMATILQNKKNV